MKYDLQLCIGSRLRRLSRIADRHFRSKLSEFNITENQMTILFVLNKKGKVEQGKIGQTLVLERSTVSRNIKLLEKQNYIKRTSDYRPEIELSKKGNELVQKLIPLWEETMDELISKLGENGLTYLSKLENSLN
ncbi:MarR family winged helix-turn-helix transcriptional regulator [Aquimarina sp. RZ0]|uniref:MarR family winged helix-turn-helix transcriptional regulator n=1 Tax=Aquimarina sp. RZ0 TaxID=2607730 RepID=UPI0011F3CA32|nr:MarR family transcriptional regulator [Aquimarina sp. RZ0]KAA1243953.1 MarR family transcriptional regulator [Aquimarina sp. RZ0]